MRKIVLVGGGGHSKVIIESLKEMNLYDEIVIVDSNISAGSTIMGCKVAGNDDCLESLFKQGVLEAFISVGSIKSTLGRRRIADNLKRIGFSMPSIIDKTAIIAKTSKLGEGVYVGKRAVINADCCVGDYSIINTAAVMEHESSCGEFCHVSIGAVCCGNVCLENDVFVGANATIIQGITIAQSTVIGAGVVVRKNIEKAGVIV